MTAFSGESLSQSIEIQGRIYDLSSRTFVMGIINLTPDSFSKDGLYSAGSTNYIDQALLQAEEMVKDGADFLDVGAESSRPGAVKVSETEEAKRLLPAVKELSTAVKVPISVDTYKPEIAQKALELGASIINDIWGLQSPDDPEYRMARVVAEAGVPIVVMHNKTEPVYQAMMTEMVDFLRDSTAIGARYGVKASQIILDPGIGFGKTYQDNMTAMRHLEQLGNLGRPVLLGVSRKSFIGLTLDLPVSERMEGTIAACIWGVMKGANIVRVHDVQAVSRAIRMWDSLRYKDEK